MLQDFILATNTVNNDYPKILTFVLIVLNAKTNLKFNGIYRDARSENAITSS